MAAARQRWYFVVRVSRGSGLSSLLPPSEASSPLAEPGYGAGSLYVFYRWDGGGVVAKLSGETGMARACDEPAFGYERSLRLETSLADGQFRAFVATQQRASRRQLS